MIEIMLLLSDDDDFTDYWRAYKWRNINIHFIVENLDILTYNLRHYKPRAVRIL